ncbi:dTDP-4-dehydrorhamnose 3,5-epimerase [Owenweeksia hongkongensis DSM 17368]|uniref:dTDP-4-dehydrorhamnose 3,5-epimerase n=1 Tax=Owenweeksia hongkongensis (strain DSM 17368 / CIP 108786 / JCM 12287 / NRRL B-23963 / UST20020801) TaxID=926562 RepID=G8R5M7_OWEHD|nr:dTDP-4-dehydrorhamnose 3,5-epimerase [Owenweeksia hongkongensis]AEV34343.1 dTDP-4-dehydrorhamnose 3,5-epimerase [Owenweeksia hongkongensis DSM 17368]
MLTFLFSTVDMYIRAMKIIETPIPGLLEIEPTIFGDDRGYFYESYNKDAFHKAGITVEFVQDNQSLSSKGVLRGLHFQNPPHAQGKLVRVIAGAVLDVALDIRVGSPTYGQHHKVELTGENKKMFWVPPGFAHGFLTLKDDTIFAYKCTALYNKESEGAVLWNDPQLNINWNIDSPLVSEKDQEAPAFDKLKSQFQFI